MLHKLFFKEREQSSKCRGCSLLTDPDCYTMSTDIPKAPMVNTYALSYSTQSLPSSPLFSTPPRSSTRSARHSLVSANPTHYSPSHHARISEGRLAQHVWGTLKASSLAACCGSPGSMYHEGGSLEASIRSQTTPVRTLSAHLLALTLAIQS